MSATSEKIDYIIKIGVHPVLKRDGFLKSLRTFRRGCDSCIQIVNVQGSWTNYEEQGQFTVNLAVYFPEAAKIDGLFRITDRPLESDCIVRQRIGDLMPIQRDYWWKFDSKSNLDEIAKEVAVAWLDYGEPWLEENSTIEGSYQFVLSRKMLLSASVFSLMLGNRKTAEQHLYDAISQASRNPRYKSRLENWGRSQGFIL
ncbi:MAG: DUF4304 domain-containing protein [Chloroflexi bacterium]|nr:DUF4304 domain-containing protein [Chloroflexota bacterium]